MNASTQQLVGIGEDPPERQLVEVTRPLPWSQLAPSMALTPMAMVAQAVASGAGIELVEKLMGLQERWEANNARKAFDAAMAATRAELPVILKSREVDYTPTSGKRVNYRHEDLAGIAKAIDPILAKHGLSYRWRTNSAPEKPISVTCIIAHRDGHSEETTLSAGRDASGGKNDIQSIGSAVTYLQRYTLKAALGLAASNDDDGQAAGGMPPVPEYLTESQVAELRRLIDVVEADEEKFCGFLNVPSLAALPAKRFAEAQHELRVFGSKNGKKV